MNNKNDQFDVTKYMHTLDVSEFSGRAQKALRLLHSGNWERFTISDLFYTFSDLHYKHSTFAKHSVLKSNDPRCIEIRKCLHILARIWARKWLERGEKELYEKRDYYLQKARGERFTAHDELLYTALNSIVETHERKLEEQ